MILVPSRKYSPREINAYTKMNKTLIDLTVAQEFFKRPDRDDEKKKNGDNFREFIVDLNVRLCAALEGQ